MSPHVGNFVQDLVEMAKATERLPGLEAELSKAHSDIESYAKQVQDREMHIIELKAEIDAKNEVIRSLEVAKDQAETMFLELDEKAISVSRLLLSIRNLAEDGEASLNPPKPQPEPVKVEITETAQDTSWAMDHTQGQSGPTGNVDQGQGEPDPTANSTETVQSHSAPSVEHQDTAPTTTSEPSPGPYSGLRYYDHPVFVPYDQWMAGGGTEEDYNWRPNYERNVI